NLLARPIAMTRGNTELDITRGREPRHECVRLEDHGAIEARTVNGLLADDHSALARAVEAPADVQDRRLPPSPMAHDPTHVPAYGRRPLAAGLRRARGETLDVYERTGAHGDSLAPYSEYETRRWSRAMSWSSTMPTRPISRIALITFVIERLFHSFQTK